MKGTASSRNKYESKQKVCLDILQIKTFNGGLNKVALILE